MKKNIKAILLILFISLFTEVFIFNIKTITSINFKQISVKSKIILGSDIIDSNGIYVVKNTKNAYIEIKNINVYTSMFMLHFELIFFFLQSIT